MNINRAAFLFFLGISFLGPLTVRVYAADNCAEPEAQALRLLLKQEGPNGPHRAKLMALPALEDREAKCRSRQIATPPSQPNVKEKQQQYEQLLKRLNAEAEAGQPPDVELGILPADLPAISGGTFSFNGGNIWQGYVDKRLLRVYAGSSYKNPLEGVILVESESSPASKLHLATFRTPLANGPVKVIAESNGILTLQALSGSFAVVDRENGTESYVTAKGGCVYRFDMKTNRFWVDQLGHFVEARPSNADTPANSKISSR